MLLSDHRDRHLVANEGKERLHERLDTRRRLAFIPFITFCNSREKEYQQNGCQQHRKDHLGDGKIVKGGDPSSQKTAIQGARGVEAKFLPLENDVGNFLLLLFAVLFHLLRFVCDTINMHFGSVGKSLPRHHAVHAPMVENVPVHSRVTVFKSAGKEKGPAFFRCIQYAGKRNVNVLPHVKFIGVGDVIHHFPYGIVFRILPVAKIALPGLTVPGLRICFLPMAFLLTCSEGCGQEKTESCYREQGEQFFVQHVHVLILSALKKSVQRYRT